MADSPNTPARIAVMIPCYNESATIAKVIRDFRHSLPQAAIYVFDNNSTDQTAEIAAEAGATVIHEKKQGKGHVVAAMFEKVRADFYVIVDGDDTYPADQVETLLGPVISGQADMTVGSRQASDTSVAYRPFHVFGNRLVSGLINLIFSSNLGDIMSGYRVLTREVAAHLPIMAYGFDIETEMTIQCLYRKWVIREVPVAYRARPEGSESKLSTFRDGLKVLFRILSLFRSYKPLTFFGGMGIVLFLAACASAAAVRFGEWAPQSGFRLSVIIGSASLMAMSLIAVSIGVIVQLINFRFLELDSILRRRQSDAECEKRKHKES